jgi:hypothetical protein
MFPLERGKEDGEREGVRWWKKKRRKKKRSGRPSREREK